MLKKELLEAHNEELSQAARVVRKFGGVPNLVRILAEIGRPKTRATIHKWTYPKENGGTGGRIPTAVWPDLLLAARVEGILITHEDMDQAPSKVMLTRFEQLLIKERVKAQALRAQRKLLREQKAELEMLLTEERRQNLENLEKRPATNGLVVEENER